MPWTPCPKVRTFHEAITRSEIINSGYIRNLVQHVLHTLLLLRGVTAAQRVLLCGTQVRDLLFHLLQIRSRGREVFLVQVLPYQSPEMRHE